MNIETAKIDLGSLRKNGAKVKDTPHIYYRALTAEARRRREAPPPPLQPGMCPVATMYEAWAQLKVFDWLEKANRDKTAFTQGFNFTRAYALLFRQYLTYRKLYPDHTGLGDDLHICLLKVFIDMGDSLDDMRGLITPDELYTEKMLKEEEQDSIPTAISQEEFANYVEFGRPEETTDSEEEPEN